MLAVDATWVVTTAAREANRIRERLADGAQLLEAGSIEEAGTTFALADQAADSLDGALGHPAAIVAGVVPGLSEDVDAAGALAEASEEIARAGAALTRAADEAGWDGRTLPGLVSAGNIDTAAIARAEPDLVSAARATERARSLLAPLDPHRLLDPLREAVTAARTELEDREPTLRRAALVGQLLPAFLGGEGPRRYLVIAQNLSDPRGSGVHVGNHAVLVADQGHLSLGPMETTVDLGKGPRVDAPADVTARYERFGSLDRLMATTYPPDFATAGELAVAQWEAAGGETLDGVISADAVWMSYALEAIGPVEAPGSPSTITADNAIEILARRTFELSDADAANELQAALGALLWQSLLERTPEARPFGKALSRATQERHVQIYSTHPEEQALLEELGAAGRVPDSANPLQVTWFGASDSRTGYFAEKQVDYQAVLSPDGWADVTLTVTLHNTAPDSPPSILLGSGSRDAPVGSYHAWVNAYLPAGARVLGVRGGIVSFQEQEGGKPVVMGLVAAESGGTTTFRVHYRVDGIVRSQGDTRRFDLDVLPQPALRPDLVRVLVDLPSGAEVLGLTRGASAEGGALSWGGAPTTPQHLWVSFA